MTAESKDTVLKQWILEATQGVCTQDDLLRALAGVCAPGGHIVTWVSGGRRGTLSLDAARSPLAVGVLQSALDAYLTEKGGAIDYIHGEEALLRLAQRADAIGFLLPPMGKDQLFPGVIKGGMLPRKTFSMGHAQEKRYYLEARAIGPTDRA